MAASVSSGVFSVRNLFTGRRFGLTYYQREYAWTRADVRALLTDLQREFGRDESSYYLGAIVYYREGTTTYLIDGQQRITTLNLLLLHLRALLGERQLDTGSIDALVLPGPDRPDFALALPEQTYLYESVRDGALPVAREGALDSEHQVAQRYVELAEDFPKELTGEWLEPFVPWLLDSVCLVGIEAADREHGWRIFESTNDRGVRLGPVDLLKGFLLVNADGDRARLNQAWREMVGRLAAVDARVPSEFLKRYLTARYADLGKPSELASIEDAFHEWVHREPPRLGLRGPDDYTAFIEDELALVGGRYATLASAAARYDPAWAAVFYNEHNRIPHHLTAILAATSEEDSDEAFAAKALLVARFLDLLFVRRLVHAKIRDAADLAPTVLELIDRLRTTTDESSLVSLLTREVAELGDPLPPPARYGLSSTNAAQVRYLLARITSAVETALGRPDLFADYVAASPPYAITHIWGERADDHPDTGDKGTFAGRRRRLPGLLLLPPGLRIDDSAPFSTKRERYRGQNLLAALLHPATHRDPAVGEWVASVGLQEHLRAVPKHFTQDHMASRQIAIARLMGLVWDPAALGFGPPPVAPASTATTPAGGASPVPAPARPAKAAPSLAAPAKAAPSQAAPSKRAAPKARPKPAPPKTPPPAKTAKTTKATKATTATKATKATKATRGTRPQVQVVRQLIAAGWLRAGDGLVGHDQSGRPNGHTATLLDDGRVRLPDGEIVADLDAAGVAALGNTVRTCDGWTFWWVDQRDGPVSLRDIRFGASGVGDIEP